MIERGEFLIGARNLRISAEIVFIELHYLIFNLTIIDDTSSAQVSNE